MKIFKLLIVVASIAVPSISDTHQRVLIPIAIGRTPGAFGSLWISELWVHNGEQDRRGFETNTYCVTLCPPATLEPGQTGGVPFFPQPAAAPGLLAYIERPSAAVTFNLRVQDLSRQNLTWGTELPVVREEEFFTGLTRLLNVPVTSEFRQMLRIYALDASIDARVHVRAFQLFTGQTLGSLDISLDPPPPATGPQFKPSYAQLSDVHGLSQTSGESRIGIEIAPLTPGLKYWAFLSVTNNETQHVTTITPQ